MKKIVSQILLLLLPALCMAQGSIDIYVSATAAPQIYAWDGAGKALVGQWPGYTFTPADEVEVGGRQWYKKTFATAPVNVIFHNGKGGNANQTANIEKVASSSFFAYDGGNGFEDVTAYYTMNLAPDTVPMRTAWLYVSTSAATAPYLYTWGFGQPDLSGAWPGVQMAGPTVTVGDRLWYRMGVKVKGGLSVILSDGGDSKHQNVVQTENIEGLADSVLFLAYDGAREAIDVTKDYASLLADTTVADTTKYVFTVFSQGPDEAYLYAYDDGGDVTNAWPGDKLSAMPTETVVADNTTWAVRRFAKMPKGVLYTMGKNGPQTGNITTFAADTVYYVYNGTTGYTDMTKTYNPNAKEVEPHTVKVYVNATTVPYLYAYNDIRENIVGNYPGKKMNAQKYLTPDNKEWYMEEFEIDTVSVILHMLPANNADDVDPSAATVARIANDIFITYDGLGKATADSTSYKGQSIVKSEAAPIETGDVKIYVQSTLDVPYLHAWDANGVVKTSGEWPGEQMSLATELTGKDGRNWYQRAFDLSTINFVIDNGKVSDAANFRQTGDIANVTTDQYYVYDGGTRATNVTGVMNQLYNQQLDTAGIDTSYVKYQATGQYAYFEAPATWGEVYAYAYNGMASEGYVDVTAAWPGKKLAAVGQTAEGLKVYKWSTTVSNKATHIIFNNGGTADAGTLQQTADQLPFYNGGYYTMFSIDFITPAIAQKEFNPNTGNEGISTGIGGVVETAAEDGAEVWYTIGGQRITRPVKKGLYILNGKKFLLR